jgi:hypothetical protein
MLKYLRNVQQDKVHHQVEEIEWNIFVPESIIFQKVRNCFKVDEEFSKNEDRWGCKKYYQHYRIKHVLYW